MTDINHPYLGDRDLEDDEEPKPLDVFAFHFTREPLPTEDRVIEAWTTREWDVFHYEVNLRVKPDVRNFYQFAFGRIQIVLQKAQFARYAKPFVRTLLQIYPETIVVIDEETGKFSGVWPQAERLQDRIRIDELDFFMMEAGDVVVR